MLRKFVEIVRSYRDYDTPTSRVELGLGSNPEICKNLKTKPITP